MFCSFDGITSVARVYTETLLECVAPAAPAGRAALRISDDGGVSYSLTSFSFIYEGELPEVSLCLAFCLTYYQRNYSLQR